MAVRLLLVLVIKLPAPVLFPWRVLLLAAELFPEMAVLLPWRVLLAAALLLVRVVLDAVELDAVTLLGLLELVVVLLKPPDVLGLVLLPELVAKVSSLQLSTTPKFILVVFALACRHPWCKSSCSLHRADTVAHILLSYP